jgi:hypothetical protein
VGRVRRLEILWADEAQMEIVQGLCGCLMMSDASEEVDVLR